MNSVDNRTGSRSRFHKFRLAAVFPDATRVWIWAPRGALAIADQGIVSGSNFLLGVILARNGGPELYGAYTLMYAAFLLIANVHQAILIEPVSVLAPTLFPEHLHRYARAALRMHAIFTITFVVLGGLTILAGTSLNLKPEIQSSLTGMIVATPCILLFWLSRCFAYLELAPGRAVGGSVLFCGILFSGLAVSRLILPLNPLIAYLCLGLASLGAAVLLLRPYAPSAPAFRGEPPLCDVWRRHWRFGRWGLGSVWLNWAQGSSISLVGGPLLGIAQVGGLNALNNLVLPMNQISQAATRVTLPRVAQIYNQHGTAATRRPVFKVGIVLVLLTSGYWLVLSAAHGPLMRLLYGQRFVSYADLLPIFSLNMIGAAVTTACDIAFNSMQSPQSSFGMKMVMVALMLPLTTLITWRFGLFGLAFSIPLMALVTAVLMVIRLRRYWREAPDQRFSRV